MAMPCTCRENYQQYYHFFFFLKVTNSGRVAKIRLFTRCLDVQQFWLTTIYGMTSLLTISFCFFCFTVCNVSDCTVRPPTCNLGFEAVSHTPPGSCCPLYQCGTLIDCRRMSMIFHLCMLTLCFLRRKSSFRQWD